MIETLIGATAAIFASALTQLLMNKFNSKRDEANFRRENDRLERDNVKERLFRLHELLSKIFREYSRTNMQVLMDSELTSVDYGNRWVQFCDYVNEVRAIIEIYFPTFSDEFYTIADDTNTIWGYFYNYLHYVEINDPRRNDCHRIVIETAIRIEDNVRALQSKFVSFWKESGVNQLA